LFNSPSALPPSGIAFIQWGDRWKIAEKNRKIKPFSFVVDDLKLIEEVEPVYEKGKYKAGKLDNALKNLKTGGTFTLFCTGDSITAGSGLRKPDSDRYAVVLQKKLREHFKDAEVKVECKGVGGARVEDLIGWTERDFSEEIPDALTIMIGYNNKSGALPGSGFKKKLNEYIDRVIAKTKGKTAIILIPTIPGRGNRFDMMDDYADAVREIAKERGLPVCDVQKTFKGMGKIKIAEYLADRAHPNPAGHKIFADKIAEFIIEKAGK
jgi:lysophospholipase L1-like esterase